MSELPKKEFDEKALAEWYKITQELSKLKSREALLRSMLFETGFEHPVEGTNDRPLSDGYVLKGVYKINRNIEESVYNAIQNELHQAGVHPDDLVRWKPELKVQAYRKLTPEQKKIMDQAIIAKPGMPDLKIVKPKR